MERHRTVTSVLSFAIKLNNRIKRRLLVPLLALAAAAGAIPTMVVANTVAGYTPVSSVGRSERGAGYTLPIGIPRRHGRHAT